MKHGFLAGVGVLLLMLTGCTEADPPVGSPHPSPTSASPASSGTPEPAEPGPAEPLGAAKITAADTRLVEAFWKTALLPADKAVPASSELAVLRRGRPAGTGDVAWMPDADTYCLVSIRERGSDRECFQLAAKRKPQGYVHVGRAAPHGLGIQSEPHRLWLTVSVVENTRGSFAFTNGTPEHAPPVQQATLRFPSGRTMTFVTYEFPEAVHLPRDAEICSAGRAVCFQAFEPNPAGS
ncbi:MULTISPECIES: hypothetical protein [Streptomyces]|uniref:Lipoprotein n=1 Tax=Streptomyces solicathayae TaxID=3081768 RepID=A0ABZ0M3T4_9ACTN|nr:hypothetical protein [Streptomyces sp. HUAS YS2]WOX26106.1 hypothetical protein R2D22_33870 [Streptomyces sp. HUAS YS2]